MKIFFKLERDEDGFPPADVESVWAVEESACVYVIDNIPFFTYEAKLGDKVEVTIRDGVLWYNRTIKSAGNSLLRVIMYDKTATEDVRTALQQIGCSSELSHLDGYFSVDVPADVPIEGVRNVLSRFASEDKCDYEEAIVEH